MAHSDRQNSIEITRAIYILCAPGFDEADVIACMDPLQSAGALPVLVCPSTRCVQGQHGLMARPALTLERAHALPLPRAILIPGGDTSVSALWADPRAHDLVAAALKAGALVGAFRAGHIALSHLAVTLNASELLMQGVEPTQDFVAALVARLASGPGGIMSPSERPAPGSSR